MSPGSPCLVNPACVLLKPLLAALPCFPPPQCCSRLKVQLFMKCSIPAVSHSFPPVWRLSPGPPKHPRGALPASYTPNSFSNPPTPPSIWWDYSLNSGLHACRALPLVILPGLFLSLSLTSASQVARITDGSHCTRLSLPFSETGPGSPHLLASAS
jgi:hypothetical protein